MESTDILSIYYGTVIPLTDPRTQLNTITAIAIPHGIASNKVCFVKFRGIQELSKDKVLLLKVYTGKRHMNMSQIIYHKGKWTNAVNGGAVYILPDVTRRMRYIMDLDLKLKYSDVHQTKV